MKRMSNNASVGSATGWRYGRGDMSTTTLQAVLKAANRAHDRGESVASLSQAFGEQVGEELHKKEVIRARAAERRRRKER